MRKQKEKRRGGIRDESVIYISYTRAQLFELIVDTEKRLSRIARHDIDYKPKAQKNGLGAISVKNSLRI